MTGNDFHHFVVSLNDLKLAHLIAALLKRWLLGTYQSAVRPSHLAYYLDEYTFRFNRRTCTFRGKLFYCLVQQAMMLDPMPVATLKVPSLWSQQESDVLRGDLLVIPIEGSILYIEPVYLVATDKSSLPELKRVIAVYGEKVEMGKSLTSALEKIFDIKDTGLSFSLDAEVAHARTDEDSITDLARQVAQYYQAAQGSIQKGDWVEYGRYQERLEEAIQELSAALELEEE